MGEWHNSIRLCMQIHLSMMSAAGAYVSMEDIMSRRLVWSDWRGVTSIME